MTGTGRFPWVIDTLRPPEQECFDADVEGEIRAGFLKTYLVGASPNWLASDAGQAEVRREIVDKYQQCLRHVVPWVDRVVPLEGRAMIEVGCGTGAKSAAFAKNVDFVVACDQSEPHVRAAEHRLAAMGISNVELRVADAESFFDDLERRFPPRSVGVCLLFAVLEHMTLDERLSTLSRSWELLAPGGVLVVLETPNRLLPWDWHSSRLPFFNMLPDDLARRYYTRSPRGDFVENIRRAEPRGRDAVTLALTRQGRGVSYHEFEMAIGDDFRRYVVADAWDGELVALNPVYLDELSLVEFVEREALDVPAAFTRYWIELVLRRAGVGSDVPAPGLPRSMSAGWRPASDPRGTDLLVPHGAREAILVVEAAEHGKVGITDDKGRRALLPVELGRRVQRVPIGPGAGTIHVRPDQGPFPQLELAFSR